MWYIIGIIVVCGVIYSIFSWCHSKLVLSNIRSKIKSNPEKALKLAKKKYDKDVILTQEYREILIRLVEDFNNKEAILELLKITKKENNEYSKWLELAAKAGDFNSITEVYGFTDYNVSSNKYDDILKSLEKVETPDNEMNCVIDYLKGVVYFRQGEIGKAASLFEHVNNSGYDTEKNESAYMLMLCYCKKAKLSSAEEICLALEKSQSFQISCEGYLELYKSHILGEKNKRSNSHDLSVMYAQKYINCSDVDDTSEDYYEALCFLGKEYWFGSDTRMYYTANKYLYFASSNGVKEAKQILDQYGVMGVLVMPTKSKEAKYRFLYNYELKAPSQFFQWNQVCRGIEFEIHQLSFVFSGECNRTSYDLEKFVNSVGNNYANHLAEMIDWSIKLLMHFGIDSYCSEDILSMCDDLSLLPRVPEFQKRLDVIDRRAAELHLKTAYSKATRGYWTGAGFGTTIRGTIDASIKSSIAAGVMNAGSGILHGIGDCIVESINNSEIKRMGQSALNTPEKLAEFTNAFKSACVDISQVILNILSTKNIAFTPLVGEVIYNGENISDLSDKVLNSKLQNHTSAQNYSYLYPLMVEKLRRTPVDEGIYKSFVLLNIRLSSGDKSSQEALQNLSDYAKDFGIDTAELQQDLERITSNS